MNSDFELQTNDLTNNIGSARQKRFVIPRKFLIVLCIILITAAIIAVLVALKPEAAKVAIPETIVRVDTINANRSNYPIAVDANGTVEAETRGNLVSQVSGEIVAVAGNFTTGGSFKKGDVLTQIDQRDFQANLSQASAAFSQAESNYRQELANSKQAEVDWRRLGNTEPAPDLVMRKPQLAAAKAQLDSAIAAQETANLNLARTTIKAPYDGRVIERRTVLGQFVTVGTPIAEVFSEELIQVRLPISQQEFEQLGLNAFSSDAESNPFKVTLTSNIGLNEYHWDATIVRTDSTFDLNTRQIDIIAEIEDPFSLEKDQPPLKIGQFVNAKIQGQTVDDVYVIPNKSIREGLYVYAVRDERLTKLPVKIAWQDDENAIVIDGLSDNEIVVTTSLNSTLTGAKAKLSDDITDASQDDLNNNISSDSQEVE